jgi:hypothetical protein
MTQTMTFSEFLAGNFDDGCNLYIIRRKRQTLYVGISRAGVWRRWFSSRGSHMAQAGTRENSWWIGQSEIGNIVASNLPGSLGWTVELRHYDDSLLEHEEARLIRELRPLFNGTHRPEYTTDENKSIREMSPNLEDAKKKVAGLLNI